MAKDKKFNVEDARAQTPDELSDALVQRKKEQLNLRFQAATGQLEKTHRFREVRREIAVIKTVMREKQRAAEA